MATPHRGNLFDLLRIAAACAVIVSHHFPITQTAPPAWLHASMVGGVAVMTFFAISGYLVTQSWLRQPEVLPFLYRRFLRIWPGLLLAVLSNIFPLRGAVHLPCRRPTFWRTPKQWVTSAT